MPLPPAVEGDDGDEGEEGEEISPAQAYQLWYRGYSVLSVLGKERLRDIKQLGFTQATKARSDKLLPTDAAVRAAEAKR